MNALLLIFYPSKNPEKNSMVSTEILSFTMVSNIDYSNNKSAY